MVTMIMDSLELICVGKWCVYAWRPIKSVWITCRPFDKNKKIQKTKGSKYICRNQLNKVCFQHDMFTRIIKI